jgi:hypothetical protein
MKRVALLVFLAGCFVPRAAAQENEHLQVGVFADYFRPAQTDNNFGGVGARVSFTSYKRLKLEAQMSYDFNQAFTEGFTNTGTGAVTLSRSGMRILHGEVGPKLDLGHGAIRPFVTVKGGGISFGLSNAPATVGTFFSSVNNLRTSNVSAVLYPGGGLEGHLGPVGLRLDVGDEIYFNSGAHHNLSMAFGPYIRF